MVRITRYILNAIEEARKAERKSIFINNLKYAIKYIDGIFYLVVEDEVKGSVDGEQYISTIAETFEVLVKRAK